MFNKHQETKGIVHISDFELPIEININICIPFSNHLLLVLSDINIFTSKPFREIQEKI